MYMGTCGEMCLCDEYHCRDCHCFLRLEFGTAEVYEPHPVERILRWCAITLPRRILGWIRGKYNGLLY